MTPDEFRRMALDLPGTVESGHSGKADFRAGGRIFATLAEADGIGTLKLSRDDQETVLALAGDAAEPAAGAWGRKGWTRFHLDRTEARSLTALMLTAWAATAPGRPKR